MTDDAKSTDIIKCPNCNASTEFSIENNALKCAHCGHMEPIESKNNVVRRDITESALNEHQ
ncbi:MAG: hypothetical protein LBH69_03470, partial [Methanomassiliicoccaceae archaeon]|nr:hypothetical protein [Methanomassiliicoccaceae archaeon]